MAISNQSKSYRIGALAQKSVQLVPICMVVSRTLSGLPVLGRRCTISRHSKGMQSAKIKMDKIALKKGFEDVMRPESNRVGSKEYWVATFARPSALAEFLDTNIGTYSSKVE